MKPDVIKISSGSAKIDGYLYSPASSAARAGLVVIAYGTDGFVDSNSGPWKTMIEGYAVDLAAKGVFSLIPEYFGKTKTPPANAVNVIEEKRDDWATGLLDLVTHARALPRVDPQRIGLLGFSLGGHLCLRIRAAAKPRALAVYFAPIFDGIGPAGQVPVVQIHHGKSDTLPFTPFSNASAIKAALELEKSAVELFPYEGADHGFAKNDKANKDASVLSKVRTLAFFTTRL